jgi:hypothetical protein
MGAENGCRSEDDIAEEYADRPLRVTASGFVVTPENSPQSSNYIKFQTSNPVVRALFDRFFRRLGAGPDEDSP